MHEKSGVTYSLDVCCDCKRGCCLESKPPLSKSRKKTISAYLKNKKIDIKDPFDKEGYSYPKLADSLFCVFLDKIGKCVVHPVKPETCVAGPITFDINFSSGKVEWFLKKSAICRYAGKLYCDEEAFKNILMWPKNN